MSSNLTAMLSARLLFRSSAQFGRQTGGRGTFIPSYFGRQGVLAVCTWQRQAQQDMICRQIGEVAGGVRACRWVFPRHAEAILMPKVISSSFRTRAARGWP